MFDSLIRIVEFAGLPALVLVMFLENVFPPIPSEVIVPFAGYMASIGSLTLPGVILAGTLGSVLGALALYWVGTLFPEERIREWTSKNGKWLLLTVNDVDRAGKWFRKYGHWAVLIGRVIPGVRSLISIPAGIERMPLGVFITYTSIGSAVWTTLLAIAGFALGNRYGDVEHVVGPLALLSLGILAAAVLGYFGYKLWQRRSR